MDHLWWAPQMHKKLSGPKMESQLRNTFGQSLIVTLYIIICDLQSTQTEALVLGWGARKCMLFRIPRKNELLCMIIFFYFIYKIQLFI